MPSQNSNSDANHKANEPAPAADKTPAPAPTCRCRCGRVGKWLAVLIVLLLLLIFAAPYIASREPFLSWVLKKALPGVEGKIECAEATFSWFSPLSLSGLKISAAQRGVDAETGKEKIPPAVSIASISGDKPLGQLLLNIHEPGDFVVDQPAVEVVVGPGGSNFDGVFVPRERRTKKQHHALKSLTTGIKINGGRFALSGPKIPQGWSAGPLDADLEIENGMLALQPFTLFDHARLTPRACQDFLRFVAPVLAEATRVDGEFSLKLDAWQIPLADPRQSSGSGLLDISSLNVEAGPLAAEIAKLLRLPPRILFVKDSPVKFYMKDARVHHADLAFYIESVQVRTEGSVGLDETLDMTVAVPMPKHLLGDGPLATALAQQTLKIPVGGTLSQPKVDGQKLGVSLQSLLRGTVKSLGKEDADRAESLVEGLIERAASGKSPSGDKSADETGKAAGEKSAEVEALIGDIISGAGKVLEERRQRREQGQPTLLDQLRQRRQERLKTSDEETKK